MPHVNFHRLSRPELREAVAVSVARPRLWLACTSTKLTAAAPCALTLHAFPGFEERRASSLPLLPRSVSLPATVCVEPARKVSVSAATTVLLRLKKTLLPPTCCFLPVST